MKRVPTRELLDEGAGTGTEIRDSLADLRFLNTFFGGVPTTSHMVRRVASATIKSELTLLEVAAGTGELPTRVSERVKGHGLKLHWILLDRSPVHLGTGGGRIVGEALALPFRDNTFDVVSCCLFVHHLSPEQVPLFLSEAVRVSRTAVLINDLVRHPVHYATALAGGLIYRSRLTRNDAPASVRQSYTAAEMRSMLSAFDAGTVEISRHSIGWVRFFGSTCRAVGLLMAVGPLMYDVAIIGAGPAGCSAAITAARNGADVLLLEQGNLPRDRVCGEFISSESMDQLRWLLGSRAEALLGTAIAVPEVRFFSDGLVIRGELNPPGTSIARFDLDFALWQATTLSSIDGPLQVRVEKIEGDSPYRLLTNAGIFKARAVVKAVGRWSNLNAVVRDPGKDHRKWIGLKAHFYESNPHPSVDLYFFDGGYCGIQPASRVGFASGDRINVCAKVRADVAANLPAVFSRHPALSERSRNWQQLTTTVSTAPLIFRRPQAVEGRILHVGDAAGFVDPFAGDGISLALRSGALCANSLKGFVSESLSLDGAACLYRGAYAKEFLSIFGMSAKVRQIFFGLPRSLRWVVLSAAQRNPGMVTYFVRRTR